SIRFRSFEDDLIDDEKWQQKDKLLADAGLTTFHQPIHEHLAELRQQLERRLTEVNQRIASGENEHVHKSGDAMADGRFPIREIRNPLIIPFLMHLGRLILEVFCTTPINTVPLWKSLITFYVVMSYSLEMIMF